MLRVACRQACGSRSQRWNDDDFVEQQARERLHYVVPR